MTSTARIGRRASIVALFGLFAAAMIVGTILHVPMWIFFGKNHVYGIGQWCNNKSSDLYNELAAVEYAETQKET